MSSRDDPSLRWDPSVTPTSPKWANQLSIFKYLLSPVAEETLDSIFKDYFTPYERQLALPATSPAWLVKEQRQYTARYRRFLAGRFAGVDDDAATRLTMLYFGLPAEPLMSGMFRALDPDVEMMDGADARIYEVRPPLHFLTAYDHRHYGRDELRGTEAPLSYIPIPKDHATALKLGRQIDELEEPPRSSLRGGGEPDDDDLMDDTEVPAATDPPENILLGFQGSIPFDPYPNAINSAIRALLSLVPHDTGRRILLTHLNMHSLRRGQDPVIQEYREKVPVCEEMVDVIRGHTHKTDDYADCCAWFVRFEDNDKPPSWVPSPNQMRKMVRFGLKDKPADLRAYLSLPDSVGPTFLDWCGKNAYSAYMRATMQVLLGRMAAPGTNHTAVRVHEDLDDVPLNEQMWCYGGLDVPHQVYNGLYRSSGRATPWIVEKSNLDTEAIALVLEGYEQVPRDKDQMRRNFEMVTQKPVSAHKTAQQGQLFVHAWEVLESMFDVYLSDEMKTTKIEVTMVSTYDMFEGGPDGEDNDEGTHPGSHFVYDHSDGDPVWRQAFAAYLEEFFKKGHRAFNITLASSKNNTLIPSWVLPANATRKDHDAVAFPLKSLDYNPLNDTIDALVEKHPHPTFGDRIGPRDIFITLEAVPMSPFCKSPPRVVITDLTHPDELLLAFSQLMSSRFLVYLTTHEGADFFARLKDAIPWGPRYGDVATFPEPREKPTLTMPRPEEVEDGGLLTNENTPRQSPLASPGPSASDQKFDPAKAPDADKNLMGPPPLPVTQPSIFDGKPNPTIPTGGPPKEPILRTGGPGVPSVTTRTMTPTEQQRARDTLNRIRNENLGRALRCHYKDCDFVTASIDTEGMEEHLERMHVAGKCPWCDTKLFAHMGHRDKEKHIAEKHADEVRSLVGGPSQGGGTNNHVNGQGRPAESRDKRKEREKLEEEARRRRQVYRPQPRAPGVPLPPPEASKDEAGHKYCDRCGREHGLFGAKERECHDKLCLPRAPYDGDLSWCARCGAKKWQTRERSRQQEGDYAIFPHRCGQPYTVPHAPFCTGCAFPIGDLKDDNAHAEHCKGFSGKVGQFCPHCGARLGYIRDHKLREKHILACRPSEDADGGNPYGLYPSCMWEEPRARPVEDQFYMGWREKLDPRSWTPTADMWGTVAAPRVPQTVRFSEVQERPESPASPEDPPEPLRTKTGKKRSAPSGEQPGPKRRKLLPHYSISSGDETTIHNTPRPLSPPNSAQPAVPRTRPSGKSRRRVRPTPRTSQPSTAPDQRRSTRRHNPARQPDTDTSTPAPPNATAPQNPTKQADKSDTQKTAKQADKSGTQKTTKKPDTSAMQTQGPTGGNAPAFKPEPGMFCSRCFRKMPKPKPKPRAKDPSFEKQMEAHMDPTLGCRISRCLGKIDDEDITLGIGLPNRSGWILEKDLKGVTLAKLRDTFKEEYPEYAPTAYLGTGTQSVWKHDPNNEKENPESVELSRKLPMPPLKDDAAEDEADDEADGSDAEGENGDYGPDDDDTAPGGGGNASDDDAPGDHDQGPGAGGDAKPKKKTKPSPKSKAANDGTYRDTRDVQSEDSEPDPENVREDNPEGAPVKKKKPAKAAAPNAAAGGGTGKLTLKIGKRQLADLQQKADKEVAGEKEAVAENEVQKSSGMKRSVEEVEDEGNEENEQPQAKKQKTAKAGRAAGKKGKKGGKS